MFKSNDRNGSKAVMPLMAEKVESGQSDYADAMQNLQPHKGKIQHNQKR